MSERSVSGERSLASEALRVEDATLALTVARGGAAGPALVVYPSAFGVGPDLAAQLSELSARASVAVAFDPFARADAGVADYRDMARVLARMRALDRARSEDDFRALIAWARAQAPNRRVVALGICFGGPFALRAAADGLVEGVATWHGTALGEQLARAGEMCVPMRLHFGGADPVVPAREVEAIRSAFAGRRDVRIAVHAGATHGFTHRTAADAYDARAERAALDDVGELLAGLA